jgi:cAMP-dependent protein kinase regulator
MAEVATESEPRVKLAEDSEEESGEEEVEDEAEIQRKLALMKKRGSRASVTAEPTDVDDNWTPPVNPKTDAQVDIVKSAMSKSFLFSSIMQDVKLVGQIVGAFAGPHTYEAGAQVISQGDMVSSGEPGLFIIESGTLDVFKKPEGGYTGLGTKVFAYDSMGQSFGELALLYNAPRAATVQASSSSVLWSIDRDTFNNCVIAGYRAQREKTAGFLRSVEIFSCLKQDELDRVLDIVKLKTFQQGESIIEKDSLGTEFFVLHEGTAIASVNGASVKDYAPGSYFGELALLEKARRKADVVATVTPTVVAVIDSDSFTSLLGNVHDLMKERAKSYEPLPA